MPIYEYRCSACEREFEYQQKMNDPELVKCEACGEDKLQRILSWTAFKASASATDAMLTQPNAKDALRSAYDKGRAPKKQEAAPAAVTPVTPVTPVAEPAPVAAEAAAPTEAASTDDKPSD